MPSPNASLKTTPKRLAVYAVAPSCMKETYVLYSPAMHSKEDQRISLTHHSVKKDNEFCYSCSSNVIPHTVFHEGVLQIYVLGNSALTPVVLTIDLST
jgi:hypothetical protein